VLAQAAAMPNVPSALRVPRDDGCTRHAAAGSPPCVLRDQVPPRKDRSVSAERGCGAARGCSAVQASLAATAPFGARTPRPSVRRPSTYGRPQFRGCCPLGSVEASAIPQT
jgi:hypothetical protein